MKSKQKTKGIPQIWNAFSNFMRTLSSKRARIIKDSYGMTTLCINLSFPRNLKTKLAYSIILLIYLASFHSYQGLSATPLFQFPAY